MIFLFDNPELLKMSIGMKFLFSFVGLYLIWVGISLAVNVWWQG